MKILSDFDGVWTDQVFEAENVRLYLAAEAARLARVPADAARGHFERFEEAVRREPQSYGWAPDGRLTAFVDEDPFCTPNALCLYLERAEGDAAADRYREAILARGFEHMTAFADHCFHTASQAFRSQHPPALVPAAAEWFAALTGAGAEIVVVSNSPAEKIVDWFEGAGVRATAAAGPGLRVRGSAGKQTLGETDRSIEVAGRSVRVDRPLYVRAIEEEDPDLVVGDVFSLDLALPHVLRTEGAPSAPSLLALRRHPHTPPWVLEGRAGGAIDLVVDGLDELVPVVREWTAARSQP